ncbi:FLYWCH-type domain-containing protein [Aphis craccivora]|uniref:FLYWCH-type domain-containing protein n=1 Tax=Aphis craccivora TaxID=307492 RepID=A0A6G0YUZ4_APHCR|nr:FLYWCH-type domain-containing protein [Aphis craccivora]
MVITHKFRFHKMLKNEVLRWTCCQSTCKCFLKPIMVLILRFLMIIPNHNKSSEQDINRQKLSNNLKKKAVEEISVFPSKRICR